MLALFVIFHKDASPMSGDVEFVLTHKLSGPIMYQPLLKAHIP